ncbi:MULTISPECIES: hypothetical protein [unclassified Paraburkholderia]|uniref:hypothetical protein n=1 Tax=unclassified Paraburkholderia TaxID=2615204 RepID=UPI001611AF31|nr:MULTISPECIES: hypothetical protein [unclassified Paraburkholderia]MBB5443661.1 hypothetical protein [Paraburkholderia sp. WSM4177]MBB5484118.1 hypothetical protein [Paraburkholderia sp. WSM4180]
MSADPKAWARKLVDEYEAGRPPKPTNVYRVAYAALGLTFPEGEAPTGGANVQKCSGASQTVTNAARPTTARLVPVPKRAPVEDP